MREILKLTQIAEIPDKGLTHRMIEKAFLDGHAINTLLDLFVFKDFQTALFRA